MENNTVFCARVHDDGLVWRLLGLVLMLASALVAGYVVYRLFSAWG